MSTLSIGTRVEICPYGKNYSFDSLGHLDGEIGEVQSLPRFDIEEQRHKVVLKLSDGLGSVEFPTQVLKELH